VYRKLVLAGLLSVALMLSGAPAMAQSIGGCLLQGTANFSPGLNNSSQAFTYNFGGSLSGCFSTTLGAPSSGTVSAGQVITGAGGEPFQEPAATGSGGCTSSTTSGIAIANWADGTVSVISYSTTSDLAAVVLTGKVVDSVTLPAINPSPGQPTSFTVITTRYIGNSTVGGLLFLPPDPTACLAAGVPQAGIIGVALLEGG
jgi:hypothetical protein